MGEAVRAVSLNLAAGEVLGACQVQVDDHAPVDDRVRVDDHAPVVEAVVLVETTWADHLDGAAAPMATAVAVVVLAGSMALTACCIRCTMDISGISPSRRVNFQSD